MTDRNSLPTSVGGSRAALISQIRTAVRAGVDWIQIREKDLEGEELLEVALAAIDASRSCNVNSVPAIENNVRRIFINDRLDIAWAAKADGLHLGETSLPVIEVVRVNAARAAQPGGTKLIVGRSCHSEDVALNSARDGADYIFFGPVFATPSKAAFGPPQGLERLAQVCAAVQIPVLAIGGVTKENAGACVQAGAAGVAAIRLFQQDDACAGEFVTHVKNLR